MIPNSSDTIVVLPSSEVRVVPDLVVVVAESCAASEVEATVNSDVLYEVLFPVVSESLTTFPVLFL
jgi:hypothetical protein